MFPNCYNSISENIFVMENGRKKIKGHWIKKIIMNWIFTCEGYLPNALIKFARRINSKGNNHATIPNLKKKNIFED